MKFTLSWLKDHLQTDASLEEICDRLTLIGLELESLNDVGARLGSFTVARVLKAEPHPAADKLKVCQVDTGKGMVQVVCGAPNARTGLIGVFAAPGTYVPGLKQTLGTATIRGVESSGMLCSERELELSDEHDGIIELPDKAGARLGEPFIKVMKLDDPVIDIAITPNRPDCLGVRGVARDLAAAGLGKLKRADPGFEDDGGFDCPVEIALDFPDSAKSACPHFVARCVRGVEVQPSPAWMQRRLRAIGLRPINALVDITNYISHDRARPLHVYDVDKLQGAVRARLGKAGETFLALDGKEYEVDDTMCVIADERSVLGLGGIIGGADTGCTQSTRNVLIEAAYFDPVRTALTGRKIGIHSDALYRFERGVDVGSQEPGVNLAAAMIQKFCGGEISRMVSAGAAPAPNAPVLFDPAQVTRLTGVDLKSSQVTQTLKKLGFRSETTDSGVTVSVPGWRPDVRGSADLVEEVIRIIGVDRVPSVALPRDGGVARPVLTLGQRRVRRARRLLASRGMVEAVNWSFIKHEHALSFGGGKASLRLANPISSEMSDMRPSLLPGLLSTAQQNRNRGFADSAMFEVGSAYRGDEPDDQFTACAGVRLGTARMSGAGRHWDGSVHAVSWADAKADALAVLAALGVDTERVQVSREAPDWYHPNQSGVLQLGAKNRFGSFGALHPATAARLGIEGAVVMFEIDLGAAPEPRRKGSTKPALIISDFQAVTRDFAFLVSRDVGAGDIVRAARGAEKKLIASVDVFDLFEDDSLGPDMKSVAIEVTLQPSGGTLTDEDIDAVAAKIVAAVKKATGGEIRQ